MPEKSADNPESEFDDDKENAGDRVAAINADPSLSLEEARNAAEGKSPNAAGGVAPSSAEGAVPSTSDPDPTNLPSSNTPTPD